MSISFRDVVFFYFFSVIFSLNLKIFKSSLYIFSSILWKILFFFLSLFVIFFNDITICVFDFFVGF